MPRSVIDHVVYSARPDEALALFAGTLGAILFCDGDESFLKYRGRLLIHTTGFTPEVMENMKIIDASPENFEAYAIQGWVEVKEVRKYDPIIFAIDHKLHKEGTDLGAYLRETGMIGSDLYGLILEKPLTLKEPVLDVLRDEHEIMPGDFWSPQAPMEMLSVKMALERGRQQLAAVN